MKELATKIINTSIAMTDSIDAIEKGKLYKQPKAEYEEKKQKYKSAMVELIKSYMCMANFITEKKLDDEYTKFEKAVIKEMAAILIKNP
ncbi:MAG: hypothetical protein OEV44_02785 [Spirochaetota bacterium]|nr:hypothetical protein [Spirochaetota bacterium]